MKTFADFLKILEKQGFDATQNVSDFYFANRSRLDPFLFGPAVASDEFATKVRWKSLKGIACHIAIKNYLAAKMAAKEKETQNWFRENHDRTMTDPDWQSPSLDFYASIDFEDFRFEFDGRVWTLQEFTYSFPTSRISPQKDLFGVDLSGVRLRNCRLINLCFSQACFDDASIEQVELVNTDFPQASFRRARLMTINARSRSHFNMADMTAAGVFGIHPLSDESLSAPFTYTQISYWRLLFWTLKSLLRIPFKLAPGWEVGLHTSFMNNTTTGLTLPETRSLKQYVTWYQYTMNRITNLCTAPFLSQVGFVSAVAATKYWTSHRALICVALFFDFFFAGFYCLATNHFGFETSRSFIDCLYASTLIFTSLGVEGIKPLTSLGQLTIIGEVITGYVVLAIFVFLLIRKVEWKY